MRDGCSYFLNFTLLVVPCLLVGSPGLFFPLPLSASPLKTENGCFKFNISPENHQLPSSRGRPSSFSTQVRPQLQSIRTCASVTTTRRHETVFLGAEFQSGKDFLRTFFSNTWPGNVLDENVCDVGKEIVMVLNLNNSVHCPEYGSNDEIRAFVGSKEIPSYNRVVLQRSSITLSGLKQRLNHGFYTSMDTKTKQTITINKDSAIPSAYMAESTTVYSSTSPLISLQPSASFSRGERFWATLSSSDIVTLLALSFAAVLSMAVILLVTQLARSRRSIDKHSGMVHRTSQNKIRLFIRMIWQILLFFSTMFHVCNASVGSSTNNGTSSIYNLNANRSKNSSILLLPLTISSFSASTRSAMTNTPDSSNYRRSSAEPHFMRLTAKPSSLGSSIIEMPSLLASNELTTSTPRNPPQSEKIFHSSFSHTTTGLMSTRGSSMKLDVTKWLSTGINTTLLMTIINELLSSGSSSPENETSALTEAGYGTLTSSPTLESNTRIFSSTLLTTKNSESDLFRSAVEHKSTQVKPTMNAFSPTIQFVIAASTNYKVSKLSKIKYYDSVMSKPESPFSPSPSSSSLLASLLSSYVMSPSLLSSLSKSMVPDPTASFVSNYRGSSPDFQSVLTKSSLSGSSNSGTDALTSFVELTSLHQILLSQSNQSLHSRSWQTVLSFASNGSSSRLPTPTTESLTQTISLSSSSSSLLSSNKSSSTTYLNTLSIFSAVSFSSSPSLFSLPSKLLSYSSLQSSLILPLNVMSSSSQYFTSFSLPFMALPGTALLPVVTVLFTLSSLPSSSLPLQTVLFTFSSLPARSLSSSPSPLSESTSSAENTESTPLQVPASPWSLSEGYFLATSSPSFKSVASDTFSFILTSPSSISSSLSSPSELLSVSTPSLQLSSSSSSPSLISLPLSSTQSMAVGLLPTLLTPTSPNSRSLLLMSSTFSMSSAMTSSSLHVMSQYSTSNSSTPSMFIQLSLPLSATSMVPVTTTPLSKKSLPLTLVSPVTSSLLSLVFFTLPSSVASKAAASTSLLTSMFSVVTSPLLPLSSRTSLMILPSVSKHFVQISATPSSRSRLTQQSASSLLPSSSLMSKVVRSILSPVESASGNVSFFSEKLRSTNTVPHSDISKTSSIIIALSLSSTANGEHLTVSTYKATSSVSLQISKLAVMPSSSLPLASLPFQFLTSSSLRIYREVSLSDTSSTTTALSIAPGSVKRSLERQKSTFTMFWPSQVSSVITTLWVNSTLSLRGSSDVMYGPNSGSSVITSSSIKHKLSPIGPNETRTINVSVPLLNILFHEDLLNESSQRFLNLSEKLWELFSSNIKGFRKLQNLRFRQGSVIADFNLLISSSSDTTTEDVNRTLSNNNGTNSHGLLFGKAFITEQCSPGLCTNSGSCEEGENGAFCSCITGYEGLRCEQRTAPIDGNYTNWSEFTECSKSCEPGGRKSRKRGCSNPSPQHGGKDCSGLGSDIEYADCNGDVRCPVSTWIWIVVGVSCGVLLIILIVVIVLCLRRRKKQSENRNVVSTSADIQANGHINIIPLEVIYEDKTLLSSASKGQTNPEFIGDDEDDDNDIYKAQLLLFLKQSHLIRPDLYNNDNMSDTSDEAPSRKASAVTNSSDRLQDKGQTEPVDITSIQVDDISPSKDRLSYKNKGTSPSTEL